MQLRRASRTQPLPTRPVLRRDSAAPETVIQIVPVGMKRQKNQLPSPASEKPIHEKT